MAEAFRSVYDIAFQVSPIILVGGIASSAPGGMLPIIGLTGQVAALAQGALSGGLGLDDFFARFVPVPGSSLINNVIGTYPFANQQVAANAIIQQPLGISLEMIAPVKSEGGYLTKLALFTSLQNSLQAHNNAGGTYNIATPSYIYTNCIMTLMQDITSGNSRQQQIIYQLDFVQPLITQQQAAAAFNSKLNQLSSGQQVTTSSWSGGDVSQGMPAQGAVQGITNQYAGAQTYPYGTNPASISP